MCLAVPGKVVAIQTHPSGITMGAVDHGGVTRTVCLDYLPEIEVGDYVVVSMGFAVSRLDEEAAAQAYEALGQIRDLSELDLATAPDRETPW